MLSKKLKWRGNFRPMLTLLVVFGLGLMASTAFAWYDRLSNSFVEDPRISMLSAEWDLQKQNPLQNRMSATPIQPTITGVEKIQNIFEGFNRLGTYNGKRMVELSAIVDDTSAARAFLESQGAKDIGSLFTTVYFWYPLDNIEALANWRGLLSPVSKPIYKHPFLTTRRVETGADALHSIRIGDPASSATNKGNGVIVGVIDVGFNPYHEAFGGTTTRILAYNDYENGAGVVYTQAQINAQAPLADVLGGDFFQHGTNVANIAAGNDPNIDVGWAGIIFTGMAPAANLLLARIAGRDDQIVNAATVVCHK